MTVHPCWCSGGCLSNRRGSPSNGRQPFAAPGARRRRPRAASLLVAASLVAMVVQSRADTPRPLFVFHSNPWLNLHHFARSVARGGPPPQGLSDEERARWSAGIERYKPYALRHLFFDEQMVRIKTALRAAEDKASLDGVAIDADARATLEGLMPIYRAHAWPNHDRANREWIAAVLPLVDRHGAAIAPAVARAYGVSWPSEPVPVDLSVSAGPSGAYTTDTPTHVTISSSDPSYRGYAGLEMLFHESSHGWNVLEDGVRQAAIDRKVTVPPQLAHGVLFFTAGELTRRELAGHGIPYTEYASRQLYEALCGPGCRDRIAEHWTPRLDGRRSVAEALAALVATFVPPPK